MGVLDRFRLNGKRAFVTGGSRGLGREMALALADVGADIVLVGREADSLAQTAGDIRKRMNFGLRCAYAHGVAAIRTHLDSIPPQEAISWPVFAQLREEWAGRVELQAVSLAPVLLYLEDAYLRAFEATALAGIGGIAAYVLVLVLLRTPELGSLIGVLRRRAVVADI